MKTLRLFYVHLHTFLLRNHYCNTDFNHIHPQTKPCEWRLLSLNVSSVSQHRGMSCIFVSLFACVMFPGSVLCEWCVNNRSDSSRGFLLSVCLVILNWSSDVYCVCVAFCSSTTIHWSSAGWRVIYRLGRWMGGGWAMELMISPLRNLCSRGQTTHTVAPHPVYHCRYPLSSSTQTLLLPPNFKFIFPSKFTFVFLLMLQPAIKMVPFKICVKTYSFSSLSTWVLAVSGWHSSCWSC